MIYYEDLLGLPYEALGNCYGLVVEAARRDGKTLKNPFENLKNAPEEIVENDYNYRVNIKEIDHAEPGAIVEFYYGGGVHVGFMLNNTLVLHSTHDRGVRTTHIKALKPAHFFEVIQ